MNHRVAPFYDIQSDAFANPISIKSLMEKICTSGIQIVL